MRYKFLFIISFFFGFSAFSFSQSFLDVVPRSVIKQNKISKVSVLKVDYEKENYNENGEIEFEFFFDSAGLMIEKNSFYNEQPVQKEKFFFDSKNNLINEEWYNASGDLILKYSTQYVFDSAGNISEIYVYGTNDSLWTYRQFTYNEFNKPFTSSVSEYFEEGDVYQISFAYDASGNLISKTTVAEESGESTTDEYTYNENGKLSGISSKSDDGTKSFVYSYENNLISDISKQSNIDGEKSSSQTQLIYDAKKLLIEEQSFNSSGKLIEKIIYKCE
jgi:YD repeat-containing protein